MKDNPIRSILKNLPDGLAFCCGFSNARGMTCKGILARLHGTTTEIPVGFLCKSSGIWERTKRSSGRYAQDTQACRVALRDTVQLSEDTQALGQDAFDPFSGSDICEAQGTRVPLDNVNTVTEELELQGIRDAARRRAPTHGELVEAEELPTKVRCPACNRVGIIFSVEGHI